MNVVFEFAPTPRGAWAFSHAADELKADREFALQAVRRNPGAIAYASEALKHDPEARSTIEDG